MLNQNDRTKSFTIQLKQAFQTERAEAAILIKRDGHRKNKTAETPSGKREADSLKNAITTA